MKVINQTLKLWIQFAQVVALVTVFFGGTIAYGQDKGRPIKGVVLDKNSDVITGASIYVVGNNAGKGTVTDKDGKFTIQAPVNAILRISFLGFVSQQVNIGTNTELTITLLEDSQNLDEVVVTAMGIRQEAKSLSYARQSIDVGSMTEARGNSLLDMLSGKAAGMQIISGGGPGASTRVIIRGNNSLTGNNQPLFVIDGIPVLNNAGESGDLDFGSPVNSINPDEIENIEILKGANASALYGSDAANGVVLITTKKAGRKQGLGVSYGFNSMFGSLYNFPTYQNIYGAGQNGRFQRREGYNFFGNSNNGVAYSADLPYGVWNPNQGNQDNRSWGMPMLGFDVVGRNGELKRYMPHPETIENMYQTSRTMTHSLSIDKLTDLMSLRFSYTGISGDDILDKFNLLTRHNFNLTNSTKITNYLDIDAGIRYVYENMENRGFRNASNRNPLYVIANMPRDASVEELTPWKQSGGQPFNFNGFTNPYWILNETGNQDDKDWFAANLTLNVKLNNALKVRLRGATDIQRSSGWDFTELFTPFDNDGGYFKWDRNWKNNNFDALLSYNKRFQEDLSLNANIGSSIQTITGDRMSSRVFMLLAPGRASLSNANGNISALEEGEKKRKEAVFGMVNLGYKSWAFLELTARNEWSSALPTHNNSYFYYSAGTSLLLTEMLGIKTDVLSSWKLRGSFAQVGNDTGFDRLYTGYYKADNGTFLGIPYFTGEDVLKNPNLKPEKTQSWEFGTEINLWDGRITGDVTYYNKSTQDQIVEADAPLASGYRREILNAGEIRNWGTEVSLTINPIRNGKFNWTSTINWAKNNSEVVSLTEGVQRYEMASGDNIKLYAEVGQPYGVFYGNDYSRNAAGNIYVGIDGKPKFLPDQFLGTIQPDWFGGWQNTFRYGPVDFGLMIDFQSGGRVWSYTAFRGGIDGNTVQSLEGRWEYTMSDLILGENTEERRGFLQAGHTVKPGANQQENYVAYPDKDRPKGVQMGNTVYDPSVGEFWADQSSMAWVSPMDHWVHNSQSSAARYIYDASYVKLREVSLGYSLNNAWFRKTPIKGARVSAVGRNVAILFQNTPKGLDPQATSTVGNAQGFERGFSLPMSTWGFDIKLLF